VIIPLKFRAELGVKFIITKGLTGCLFVLTEEEWRVNFDDKFQSQPILDPHTMRLQRFFCAEALDAAVDSQGRVALSSALRDHAGIGLQSEVMIVGMTNRLEIWSKVRWDAFNSSISEEDLIRSAAEVGVGRGLLG
jgi:MraZ protein